MTKTCTHCEKEKEESEFYPYNTKQYPGRTKTVCKKCENKKSMDRYYRVYKNSAEYKDAECKRRIERDYGITKEDYEIMYSEQEGRCAVCGTEKENRFDSSNSYETLYVDHCHEADEVRGLLCRKCNLGIGYLKDSPESLERAAEYIRNHRNTEY